MTHGDLDEARDLAQSFGAVHKTISIDELLPILRL